MRTRLASAVGALVLGALVVPAVSAGTAWGPEAAPFNIEVVLRDPTGGGGFGLVKFRQANDDAKIIDLGTWVRDLQPDHSYLLQRAVDTTLDGVCTSSGWLTLGQGMTPAAITTDGQGTGRAHLFRDLAVVPLGARFDIHFQVVDATTLAPVLASGCYEFAVSL